MGAGNAPYSVWAPWGPPCNWCASRKAEFYLRVLANPGQKAKLVERLKFLRCGPMAPATMHAVIDGYWKLLHDDVYGDPKGQATAAELDKRVAQLKQWISDRAAYLDGIVGPCP
jgi:hypothetical protein